MSEEVGPPKAISYTELTGVPLKHVIPAKKTGNKDMKKVQAWVDEYMRDHPGEYDQKLVARMKVLGQKRPDWIPTEHWNSPKKNFDPLDQVICYMAAWGLKPTEIGTNVGVKPVAIQEMLSQDRFKLEVKSIQEKIWGRDPKKWIESILPDAIQTAVQIMNDATAKHQTRLNAAQDFMDRVMGKPKQELEVTDGSMRQVIEKLDRLQRLGAVGSLSASEAEKEAIDAEFKEVQQVLPDEEQDFADRWAKEHLCQKSLPGKNP